MAGISFFVAHTTIGGRDKLVILEKALIRKAFRCNIIYKVPIPTDREGDDHLIDMAEYVVDEHHGDFASGLFTFGEMCVGCQCSLKDKLTKLTPTDEDNLKKFIEHLMSGGELEKTFKEKERYG